VLAFALALMLAPFPDVVDLDMKTGWLRRDWRKCADPTAIRMWVRPTLARMSSTDR